MPRFGSAVDLMKVPIKNIIPEKSATAPASPVSGQMWTDTSVTPNKLKWFDGTSWIAADYSSLTAGFITNSHVSGTANIALSKLATDPLARANHTGTQLAATISDFDTQVRTSRLDQLAAPTAALNAGGQKITSLADPVLSTDAANKNYVDNARAGISVKDPVRVVATSNVTLATPGATIDGVTMVVGDRWLAANQSTATQNGIYLYNGASTAATRSADADGVGEVFDGSMVAVAEGTSQGYQFIQTASASGAPGSWSQVWVAFQTGGQTYVAGNGLTLAGSTFSLSSPVSIANGGTGATNLDTARANLSAIGRTIGNNTAWTAGGSYVLPHGFSTLGVNAIFRLLSDGKPMFFDWYPSSTQEITVLPDVSYANGQIIYTIFG